MTTELMTERELQDAIVTAARLGGWLHYHTYDSRRSQPGFPDLVLVHPHRGETVFWECKSASGRVTDPQHAWLDALTGSGQRAEVIRPADLDSAIDYLIQPRRKEP